MTTDPANSATPNSHPQITRLAIGLLLTACYAVIWNLSHFYRGLDHDAHLYALQALNHLHPDLYSNDIFFRFGSQDSFTVFTAIYAPLVAWIGLDNTASLLTLASTALYFCGAWLVAKRLAGPSIAWLATGLLIVCELYYGGFQVFKTAEEFLTARLPAEAIGLCAIAAWLSQRRALCVALLLFAALLHPLMAVPVIALIALLAVPRQKHRILFAAACIGYAVVVCVALAAPLGPFRLVDDEWLSIIRLRSYYLFPTTWSLDGWNRTAVVVSTLALGALIQGASTIAAVCRAMLIICVTGVLLSLSTEIFPIQILLQGQSWRWLWLGGVIALICLPAIIQALWLEQRSARVSAVLLCSAWLLLEVAGGPLAALSLAIWIVRHRVSAQALKLLRLLGLGVAMITLVWTISNVHTVMQWHLDLGKEPLAIEKIRNIFGLTAPAALVVTCLWLLAIRAPARVAALLLSCLLAVLVPMTAGPTIDQWSKRAFARSTYVDFRDWRAIVPPGGEVLWLWNPVSTWLLLERPSYMSLSQSAGLLFSRQLAIEIDRRTRVLEPLGDQDFLIVGGARRGASKPFSRDALTRICRDRELGFVVAGGQVGPTAGMHEWPRRGQFVWLYDCNVYRQASAAT